MGLPAAKSSSGSWPTHKTTGQLLKIFLHVHAPMFAGGRHEEPHGFFVMHHGAIGAEIEPAFIGIARDSDARRTDKSAAIELMNFRHWKFQYVDGVAGHGVFKDRSCLYNSRRNRLKLVEFLLESADELQSHAV